MSIRALRRLIDPGDWLSMQPALDPEEKLLSLDHTPNAGMVKLRLLVGSVILVVAAVVIYLVDGFMLTLVAGGFGAFAALNLVVGITESGYEKSMLITDTTVFVKTRGLFGRRKWEEPIANYRGVLLHERQIEGSTTGTMEMSNVYHAVELVHSRSSRTVPLYVRKGGQPPRDIQEAFARRFELPALYPDSETETVRRTDALDQTIAAAAETAADPGQPPSGVVVARDGDALGITLRPGRIAKAITVLFWIILPLALGGFTYMLHPPMGPITAAMVVILGLVRWGASRLMFGKGGRPRPTLHIGGDRIWVEKPDNRIAFADRLVKSVTMTFGFPAPELVRPDNAMPRNAVEQIRIDTYAVQRDGGPTFRPRLLIEGDADRVTFIGGQFDRGKLEWVREYVRFVLAQAPAPAVEDEEEPGAAAVVG